MSKKRTWSNDTNTSPRDEKTTAVDQSIATASTDLERFVNYAFAFEYAFASDDWSGLAAHFDEHAYFRAGSGLPRTLS